MTQEQRIIFSQEKARKILNLNQKNGSTELTLGEELQIRDRIGTRILIRIQHNSMKTIQK